MRTARIVPFAVALLALGALSPDGAMAARPSAPAAPVTDTLRIGLDEAIARALRGGEEMRLARSQVMEAHGRVHEALSAALPQLNGTVTYNRKLETIFTGVSQDTIFGPIFKSTPFAAVHSWTAELTGSWLVWSSGKTGAAMRGAKDVYRSAAAGEDEAAAQTAYLVKSAYLEAAYQAALIDIAESGLTQARAHLAQVKLYRGQGMRSEYDLLRAQVDASNQEPPVVAAHHGLEIAMLELKRIANIPLEQPLVLTTALDFGDAGVPMPAEPLLSAAQRHALQAAEADVKSYEELVRVQRGFNFPDLTLQSTLSHQAFPMDPFPLRQQFRRNWDVSLKLEMPIFTGFRVTGLVDQAKAQLERAKATRDRLRRQTEVELAEARAELARTLAVLAARRETVRQAERAHQLSAVRFTNGLSTQLETSDARLQLQTAAVNEVQAERDYRLALARLELVMGRPVQVTNRSFDEISLMMDQEGNPR